MSRQKVFLFNRDYMDYHSDRFKDHSVMVYRKSKLFALLPANEDGTTIWSHQGLTYGGLLTLESAKAIEIRDALRTINNYYKTNGFQKVIYKALPYIYQAVPSQEDLYFLTNLFHAKIIVRNLSSTIDMSYPVEWQRLRKRCVNKAIETNVHVSYEESDEAYAIFWQILEDNLWQKYKAKPVHTLDEILLLHNRFPDNIQLYLARQDEKVLGGCVFYISKWCMHTQYISATQEGKAKHAIDAIFNRILSDITYHDYVFFDFGTSNEDNGRFLNESLIFEKEGFGGRGVCYDWYEYPI